MNIDQITSLPNDQWLRMRMALWQEDTEAEHGIEMQALLNEPQRYAQFIASSPGGMALGFAEASIRADYVNGTSSSPVAFLEGIYVQPAARHQGMARALVQAVAGWAKRRGCHELASDTALENALSQIVHQRLGFEETERVVYFNMQL